MGGKNHQPCSGYLKNSTNLSRAFSVSRVVLEQANIALEDLILAELGGGTGDIQPIIIKLVETKVALGAMMGRVNALRQQMDEAAYTDLPSLRTVNLANIGVELAQRNQVDATAWTTITKIMRTKGFYGVLDFFAGQITTIKTLIDALIQKFEMLRTAASVGAVADALEENRPENIRNEFAAVYTTMTNFEAMFLASALISTSLWYAHKGYGSLVSTAAHKQISAS
jgi:hypothetical protein